MNTNTRKFWTTIVLIVAIVTLCLATIIAVSVVFNNAIEVIDIAGMPVVEEPMEEVVVEEPVEEPVVEEPMEEPVVEEPMEEPVVEEPVVEEPEVEEPVVNEPEPTYWSNYSCSDLGSCTIAVAPAGGFTIGFTREQPGTCTWKIFEAGENISYQGINEIHSYKGTLPLTSLDGFVESQFQFVDACTN